MIKSVEIQKNSNTFFIIKTFNRYLCYETCMGNIVKIQGQSAVGQINRMSFLVPYLKHRDKTSKYKIFYYEFDTMLGLRKLTLPTVLKGRRNSRFYFEEGSSKIVDLNYKPSYDMILRGPRLYFCIEAGGNYFLYDDDFGNPLQGDIVSDNGKSFIVSGKSRDNTLKIINSLSDEAIVYSLKVTKNGIVKGSDTMSRFNFDNAKKAFETTKKEKVSDKTRMSIIKRNLQQKKIDSFKNP